MTQTEGGLPSFRLDAFMNQFADNGTKVKSGSELFSIAIDMELAGQEFYRKIAAKTQNPSAKRFFEEASSDEARHVNNFRRLREELVAGRRDMVDEGLSAVAQNLVLPDRSHAAKVAESGNLKEAIELSIEMEANTIQFYRQLAELYPQHRDIINEILQEEVNHLTLLQCMPY